MIALSIWQQCVCLCYFLDKFLPFLTILFRNKLSDIKKEDVILSILSKEDATRSEDEDEMLMELINRFHIFES